jgi:hypothetical protein
MTLKTATPSDDVRTRLAHAVGFHDYPPNATAEPYLAYVIKSCGGEDIEEYLELFVHITMHFKSQTGGHDSIQALIDKLVLSGFRSVFQDTGSGDDMRKEHVEDVVMCIIGTWATMLSSFQNRCRQRKVIAAYGMFLDSSQPTVPPYDNNVAGLVIGSELLPGGRWDRRMDFEADAVLKVLTLLSNTPSQSSASSMQNLLVQSTGRLQSASTSKYTHADFVSQMVSFNDLLLQYHTRSWKIWIHQNRYR